MTYPNYYLWENEEFPMVAARVVIMGGTTAQSGEKFATDTRDEDGSNYAWNRQYATVTGRFTGHVRRHRRRQGPGRTGLEQNRYK